MYICKRRGIGEFLNDFNLVIKSPIDTLKKVQVQTTHLVWVEFILIEIQVSLKGPFIHYGSVSLWLTQIIAPSLVGVSCTSSLSFQYLLGPLLHYFF